MVTSRRIKPAHLENWNVRLSCDLVWKDGFEPPSATRLRLTLWPLRYFHINLTERGYLALNTKQANCISWALAYLFPSSSVTHVYKFSRWLDSNQHPLLCSEALYWATSTQERHLTTIYPSVSNPRGVFGRPNSTPVIIFVVLPSCL